MGREIIQNLTFRKGGSLDTAAISKFIEEQYLKSNRPAEKKQKLTFSPSSIGGYNGLCPRYWYMAFKGATFVDNNDAVGIAVMSNGTFTHDRIQSLLNKSGSEIELEVEIKIEDPPVRGFVDLMMKWEDDVVIGEIKSTRQEVFLIRQATMKPSAQHLIQVLLYLKATKKTKGFLMYENKNTQEFLIIPVEYSERNKQILNDVLDWMRTVYKNYEEGELPTRPYTKRNKICQGCPIFDDCWSAEAGTVTIPPMEVPTV